MFAVGSAVGVGVGVGAGRGVTACEADGTTKLNAADPSDSRAAELLATNVPFNVMLST